jgi:hypothetical protein
VESHAPGAVVAARPRSRAAGQERSSAGARLPDLASPRLTM